MVNIETEFVSANSVDPEWTGPEEQSHQVLRYLQDIGTSFEC